MEHIQPKWWSMRNDVQMLRINEQLDSKINRKTANESQYRFSFMAHRPHSGFINWYNWWRTQRNYVFLPFFVCYLNVRLSIYERALGIGMKNGIISVASLSKLLFYDYDWRTIAVARLCVLGLPLLPLEIICISTNHSHHNCYFELIVPRFVESRW